MDRRVKFRHIEAFVEICRHNSLKRAGETLGLTQPAMSKTLRDLEEMLGTALMTRGRAGVRLTAPGEVFLQFAQSSLGALQQGFDGLARMKDGGVDSISVGALPSVAARVLPQASQIFRQLSPGTVLHFTDGPHGFLMDRLRSGTLDLVVGRMGPPKTMKRVSFTQLYSETVAVVVRPDHPAKHCTSLAQLSDWPVIYPGTGSAIRSLVDRMMIAEGFTGFADRIETVSGAYGRGLTRSSDAVWFISEGVVSGDIDAGLLVKLPIETSLTTGPVGMMTRADEPAAAHVRVFRRSLNDAISELMLG